MNELNIHVGETREAMAARFVRAWRRAEHGDQLAERHLSFDSFETMISTITPKRLALLRHVHRHPVASVAALARAMGRDYKRVYEDVAALTEAGLVERTDGGTGLSAPYHAIQTTIAL